jgi:molecular chaperone DnaJ
MDFYLILGVAQDASTADIKRAYRRLARRYHPGVNPGDRAAEEAFRRISEAYETLADPGRRRQYDETGGTTGRQAPENPAFEFTEFDFSLTAHGPQAGTFSELFADVLQPVVTTDRGKPEIGADLHASVSVSFVEAIRGVGRQIMVTRQVTCSVCRGAGRIGAVEGRCAPCGGTGRTRWARGHMVFSKICSGCAGTGRKRFETCAVCNGQGRGVRGEPVVVVIPPGVVDGSRVRVPEAGHAGRHGGRTGDLYVTVHVQPHPVYRREGDDLHCVIPVAIHEAVLGARIALPTLDGPVNLRIPPGTQGGQRFRLSGRGVANPAGASGDLIVEVRLVLPTMIDERSKELMREFGRINQDDVRKNLERADS